ncbi:hypothetical protein [Streptomyces cucumeris]
MADFHSAAGNLPDAEEEGNGKMLPTTDERGFDMQHVSAMRPRLDKIKKR